MKAKVKETGEQKSIEWSGKIGSKCAQGKLKEMLDRKENSAWGEEDDEKINELCSFVYENYRAEEASDRIAWLKSLKERYAWKPSEAQLISLARASNRCVSVEDSKILIKLLEQLKAL